MSTIEHRGRIIEAQVVVAADPERAWQAWADPAKLAGWFVDRAVGHGRAGEVMTWIFERFGLELDYRVLESVPGERIVFGPASADVPPFVLEVVLTRQRGHTLIRLVNSGFSGDVAFDEQFAGIESGWRMALCLLVEYLERHFGEPRLSFMALRPARFEYRDLLPWFTDAGRLSEWLGAGGGIGDPGGAVALRLIGGDTLSGEVLCRTQREVALRWSELRGTCELKAFSQGATRVLCIRGTSWGTPSVDGPAWETRMEAALARLAVALEAPVAGAARGAV